MVLYLDNMCTVAKSQEEMNKNMVIAQDLLICLGFVINVNKMF